MILGIDPRAARAAWTVFLVAAALFIVYSIRTTLLIVVFAIFFAYLLFPLVQFVDRHAPRRVPRIASLGLVFVAVLSVVVVAGALLGSRIVDEANRLGQQLPTMLDTTNLTQRIPIPGFLEPQRERLLNYLAAQLKSGTGQALPFAQHIGTALMHVAGNLIYVVVVPILSFLLIKEAESIKLGARHWLGRSSGDFWLSVTEDLNQLLASYVRALVLLSIATFISYGVVLSAMGVPYSAMLAGAAALMEVIPVAGPVAAVASILVVCLFSGYEHILWVVAFIAAYRLFQDYALAPYLLGHGVEISSLWVIFGLLAGEELGGVAGIFLAVPVLAAAKIILARLRARQAAAGGVEQASARR